MACTRFQRIIGIAKFHPDSVAYRISKDNLLYYSKATHKLYKWMIGYCKVIQPFSKLLNHNKSQTISPEDYHQQGSCVGRGRIMLSCNDQFCCDFLPLPYNPVPSCFRLSGQNSGPVQMNFWPVTSMHIAPATDLHLYASFIFLTTSDPHSNMLHSPASPDPRNLHSPLNGMSAGISLKFRSDYISFFIWWLNDTLVKLHDT